jgi:drug/metabolite transporter (DMT)-like permease
MEVKPAIEKRINRSLPRRYSLISKTAVVSAVVVATNVIANYALNRGLREIGIVESWSPLPYIETFSKPWVAIGVIFMAAWLITRLSLLSWADLTYVLPVTSFSYVLTAIVGVVYAHEHVSNMSWAGICLITLGILLVLLTYPKTTNGSSSS